MTPEDILYLVLLTFCTTCGTFVRQIVDPKRKQIICTAIGVILLLMLSGYHILHLIILTLLNAAIILNINKKQCHVVSFIFCFSYLMFVRMSGYFGIPSPPETTNTALMIMVLKMVGLAYEVNIHHLKTLSADESDHLKETYSRIKPTLFDIVQYSFCYAGVLVGPYYKYRVYEDMLYKPYSINVSHFNFLKKRIAIVPLYIILYLISDYLFPLSFAGSDELYNYHFLYRLLYMLPWFFSFRMKIYVAFVLGECICINLGLGAYPEECLSQPGAGPTNINALHQIEKSNDAKKIVSYDFETIRCMDEFASEFRPTIREGIRYWNMTVQYWLAIYIYRKTHASKPIKMLVTMFVSAIWHGVRPGYYLSLLGTPLLLLSEIQVEKAFRRNLSETIQKVYDFFWYFIKMQCISYMGVAFILTDTRAIIHYWKSIYYAGHFFTLFLFAAAFLKIRLCKRTIRNQHKNLVDTKTE